MKQAAVVLVALGRLQGHGMAGKAGIVEQQAEALVADFAPADVVVWHSRDPGEPFYCYGMNHVAMVFRNGRLAVSRSECGEVTVNRG